jgi:predicted amidohydrolase
VKTMEGPPSSKRPARAVCKVAALQYRATLSNVVENIRRLSSMIAEAADNGARIIVLPELCTTGLNIESEAHIEALAESIPGPATDAFASLARNHGTHIILGLAEADRITGEYYNSQVIIDPDGEIIGKYRKIHLFGPDLVWATVGNLGYQAVETHWGRIGLGICCDINYWELMYFLSGTSVDLFAFSTNWVGDELPFQYWSDMVADRGVYLVAANNWGIDGELSFSGGSLILAPDLSVLSQASAPENTIIYAELGRQERSPLPIPPPPGEGTFGLTNLPP